MGHLTLSTLTIPVFDQEFYFTARDLIHEARHEILFSTFKLESKPSPLATQVNLLLSELISVSTLIPTTQVLLNYNSPQNSISKINFFSASQLKKHRIDVRYLPNARTVHAKLLIVDQKHVLLGSHNWSIASLTKNFEVSLHTQHPETVAQVRVSFLNVFQDAKPF